MSKGSVSNKGNLELPRRRKRKCGLDKKLRMAQRSGCTYRDLQVAESIELYARVDSERFLKRVQAGEHHEKACR